MIKTMADRDTWLVTIGLRKALDWAMECEDIMELIDKIKEELEKH